MSFYDPEALLAAGDPRPTRRAFLIGSAAAGTSVAAAGCRVPFLGDHVEVAGGWRKSGHNPVLGGELGTCFDASVLHERGIYRMWFSWRPRRSIAYTQSHDGITWRAPVEVLGPASSARLALDANRPSVIVKDGTYRMWYTAQTATASWINCAASDDGLSWRECASSGLMADQPWEKGSLMSPDVLWDDTLGRYRMWYSGGGQYEPEAIGYCESPDGVAWTKRDGGPIFKPNPALEWEKDRVAGSTIKRFGNTFLMFYIGFEDIHSASIGIARSPDGITGWQRHPANPVIRPGGSYFSWDRDAVYKTTVVQHADGWILWYNGRRKGPEQIGVAYHDGLDLGFPD